MQIYEYLGNQPLCRSKCGVGRSKRLPYDTAVGLEIELENCLAERVASSLNSSSNSSVWNVVGDGSLRNDGVELVLKYPLKGRRLENALKRVQYYIENVNPNCKASIRTSVHVHLDVRDISRKQLANFLCLYTVLEDILFDIGGKDRKYNNNTTPSSTIADFGRFTASLFREQDRSDFRSLARDNDKYCSCNVRSIIADSFDGLRGSVEIRMHEGTKDVSRIIDWINLLCGILEASKHIADIDIILKDIIKGNNFNSLKGALDNAGVQGLEDIDNFSGKVLDGAFKAKHYLEERSLSDFRDKLTKAYKPAVKTTGRDVRIPHNFIASELGVSLAMVKMRPRTIARLLEDRPEWLSVSTTRDQIGQVQYRGVYNLCAD
jgi:hypothetical protein